MTVEGACQGVRKALVILKQGVFYKLLRHVLEDK